MLVNKYVDQEFWDDLSPKAQDVLNKFYEHSIKRNGLVTPKIGFDVSPEAWEILIYNMSLIAAWSVDDILPEIIIEDTNHNLPEN